MQFKTHPSMMVIYKSFHVTMKDFQEAAGTSARELYAEAFENDLIVSGPVYWIYTGMDSKPDTVFTLEVALPVSRKTAIEDNIQMKELPAFQCISTLHEGSWDTLKDIYPPLIQRVQADGLQLNGMFREMYINIDFDTPEHNLTEVQVGILQ